MSLLKTNKIVSPDGRTLLNSTGSVIQVKSSVKTDRASYTLNNNSWNTVSDLSLSITPNSTANKILVLLDFACGTEGSHNRCEWALFRGSNRIYVGDASSSAGRATGKIPYSEDATVQYRETCVYLDNPSTNSSIEYSLRIRDGNSDGGSIYINQSRTGNASNGTLSASSIILMEVCG